MSYEIRALADGDGCNSLSLGDAALVPLKTFLRKEAKRLHKDNLAKTFVLVRARETTPLAYATLVCTHVPSGSSATSRRSMASGTPTTRP